MAINTLGFIATFVFAVTGVLASAPKTQNIFGLIVLGIITALGGGTIRDMILDVPVFWLSNFIYVWIALAGSLAAFVFFKLFQRWVNALLYLDALGVAIFAISAMDKSFAVSPYFGIAVIMGVITGIGGGLIRDVLAGRPTLLVTQDLYASPILAGCVAYVLLSALLANSEISAYLSMLLIFGFRAAAIHWDLSMPDWLNIRQK